MFFSHLRVVNTASKMDPMPRPSAKYLYNNLITIMIILIIMIMIIILIIIKELNSIIV